MKVRLTTLSENTAARYGYMAEWGLSILVECGQDRVLLDTGLTHSVIYNAHASGVNVSGIKKVVLSHGHGDHTGGLRYLLHEIRSEVDVYAHPDVWGKKYSIRPEAPQRKNFVGIPFRREELEYLGASFHFSKEPVWLNENMVTTGEVPMTTAFESVDKNLYIKTANGFEPDPLTDDQALVVKLPSGLVVILGCAHRGMINTLLYARQITGIEKIYAVVGGTHLIRADTHQVDQTIAHLKDLGVERIGVSHCTGMFPAMSIAEAFGKKFFFNHAGTTIEL